MIGYYVFGSELEAAYEALAAQRKLGDPLEWEKSVFSELRARAIERLGPIPANAVSLHVVEQNFRKEVLPGLLKVQALTAN